MKLLGRIRNNKKGQATVELAIMGAVVLMLLGYLVSQGNLYNQRQALEMYTFRRALELSKNGVYNSSEDRELPVAVNLTVMRDVPTPSFFSSLSRQRITASASVDCNPWIVYLPDAPGDLANRQLLQIGEKMIQDNLYIEVPPTHIKVVTNANKDAEEEDQWSWVSSSVREIDPQSLENAPAQKISTYRYATAVGEDNENKEINKELSSQEINRLGVTFETADRIQDTYGKDDWTKSDDDSHIREINVDAGTIPRIVTLELGETVSRQKETSTPH